MFDMFEFEINKESLFLKTNYFCIATTAERLNLWEKFSKQFLIQNKSLSNLTQEQIRDLSLNNSYDWKQEYNCDWFAIGYLKVKEKEYLGLYIIDKNKKQINQTYDSYESYREYPVIIMIDYYLIDEVRVGFVDITSRLVDHSMISDFLLINNKEKFDAMNFSSLVHLISQMKNKQEDNK